MIDFNILDNTFSLDLSRCEPVNELWPNFVAHLGIDKAQQAVKQAIDLQIMYGNEKTIPMLIIETCGIALVNTDLLHAQTGFACFEDRMVLIFSSKNKFIQLLYEV